MRRSRGWPPRRWGHAERGAPCCRSPPRCSAILSTLVEERCGFCTTACPSMALFGDKVSQRAVEAGFESLLDYYYFLRYDPAGAAELDALVRGPRRPRDPSSSASPISWRCWCAIGSCPPSAPGAGPRVWFAACATGPEPLTVAMMLAEHDALAQVDLVAHRHQPEGPRQGARGRVRRPRARGAASFGPPLDRQRRRGARGQRRAAGSGRLGARQPGRSRRR